MKILLVNYEYPPYGGGAGNATCEIARSLQMLGFRVTVLTSREGPLPLYDDGINKIQVGARRKFMERSTFLDLIGFLLGGLIWANSRKSSEYSLVITFFSIPSGVVGWMLKRQRGVPYIVSLRGADVPGFSPEISYLHQLVRPLRRMILRSAAAVVANSHFLSGLSVQADGIPTAVIANGVDPLTFSSGKERSYSEDDKRPLQILMVSRLHPQKRVVEAVKVLSDARAKGFDFHLSIVGDGSTKKEIQALIEDGKLAGRAQLFGWLDKEQLVRQYRQADCYLSLSSAEGLPNAVLEAMASGLPVVLSDIPPHRELVIHEANGLLVPVDSGHALISALKKLQSDAHLRKQLARSARTFIEHEYSWERCAKSYLELLDDTEDSQKEGCE